MRQSIEYLTRRVRFLLFGGGGGGPVDDAQEARCARCGVIASVKIGAKSGRRRVRVAYDHWMDRCSAPGCEGFQSPLECPHLTAALKVSQSEAARPRRTFSLIAPRFRRPRSAADGDAT